MDSLSPNKNLTPQVFQMHLSQGKSTKKGFRLPTDSEIPVIATCVNHGFAASGLVENWALSLARLGLEKHVLIVALDDHAAELTKNMPGTTLRWNAANLPAPSSDSLLFRREGWKSVVFSKVSCVSMLLGAGYPVLFSDADVVFLRDPLPWFPDEHLADFAFQSDTSSEVDSKSPTLLCSGLYFALPTPAAIETLNYGEDDLNAHGGEQDFLRRRLASDHSARCTMLPLELFPNGAYWQERSPSDPVAVHANWVVGDANKIALLRRTGLWLL